MAQTAEIPGTDERARSRARRAGVRVALIVTVLVLVVVWIAARATLDDGDPQAVGGPEGAPVVAVDPASGLTGPVQTSCVEPLVWVASDLRAAFLATVVFEGEAAACVDVYRVPDEDPAKDYYRAVASARWATQSRDARWVWQATGEPRGEVWVELAWEPATVDNYWMTEWAEFGPCPTGGETEIYYLQGLVAADDEFGCGRSPVVIGQPEAEVDHVAWSVPAPQERDATAMTVDVAVPEGEMPHFTLGVRQVDLEG
ncbi:hypothetical protein [Demequina sp. NBRC 110051]|uniref:hypothetical protein n=1 Tax=Demequina sp. NBRC 110051 TaxID=1570340 RepID=UPI00117D8186|nr:hypothetical protein [Demequina sp. NBRC 110051]